MKKKYSYFFLVLFFVLSKIGHSQQPTLTIYYYHAEKSKDSHSTTENITLTGITLVYSVAYSGRRGPNQKNERKEYILNQEQVSSIWQKIDDKKLTVTDSLIENSLSDNTVQSTTTITIMVTNGTRTSKTKIKGSPSALQGKPLYKNSLSLLNLIKGMLKN